VPAVLLGEVEPKSNEQHAKGREQSSVRLWIFKVVHSSSIMSLMYM
jgi:hypothetical protein